MVRVKPDPAWSGLVVLVGLGLVGRGYLGGDTAAYCAQAWDGDLSDRAVHVGYVALAAALAGPAGRDLPVVLDVVNVLAAVGAALAAARLGPRGASALVAAGLLLPWAPFAEVDVPWIALVLASAAGLPGAALVAVTVSPTALLALPWVAWHRRSPAALIEGAAAVGALTLASGGDWWWGPRGVLEPRHILVGRNLGAAIAAIPWLVVLPGRPGRITRPLLAASPLLLAPADVPAAALIGIVAGIAALDPGARGGLARAARAGALGWLVLGGAAAASIRADRVADEHAQILEVLRHLEPGDGLIAPFTWGARASVIATGDPYGLPWHPEGRFLRDQEVRFAQVDGTIRVLGPRGSATPSHPRRSPAP